MWPNQSLHFTLFSCRVVVTLAVAPALLPPTFVVVFCDSYLRHIYESFACRLLPRSLILDQPRTTVAPASPPVALASNSASTSSGVRVRSPIMALLLQQLTGADPGCFATAAGEWGPQTIYKSRCDFKPILTVQFWRKMIFVSYSANSVTSNILFVRKWLYTITMQHTRFITIKWIYILNLSYIHI
jgi:hypothetical protein